MCIFLILIAEFSQERFQKYIYTKFKNYLY